MLGFFKRLKEDIQTMVRAPRILEEKQRHQARYLRAEGYSIPAIARTMGVTENSVRGWMKGHF